MSRRINVGCRAVALGALVLCLLAPWCADAADSAIEAGEAVPALGASNVRTMSFIELFKTGGVLMYPIMLLSVIGVALVVYFALVLRAEQVVPERWFERLRASIRSGDIERARAQCEEKPSPVAAIASAALEYCATATTRDPNLLKEIIEGEGSRQAAVLQNQVQYLLDIAVVAPMIGLLGTVIGMLQAFNVVALDIAKAKPMLLAQGVSLALITTIAGLIVAIPSMIFYSYYRHRAAGLVARLEVAAANLLTWLSN